MKKKLDVKNNLLSKTPLRKVLRTSSKFIHENIGIAAGCLILFLLLSILSPEFFLSKNNWVNILRQISTNFLLSIGIQLSIILAGIDLSGGSTLALSGVICTSLISLFDTPIFLAIIIALLSGVIIGLLNGYIIAYTDIPPFVVTIATMNIGRGAAYLVANGNPIRCTDPGFEQIGLGYLGEIPLPVIYYLIIMFLIYLLLNRTKTGRHIYAIGGNKQAALFSGINPKKINILVYAISGLLAAVAGVILASRMASGQPSIGVGYEADGVAASVLGGTSMTGGIGKVGGMFLGCLLLGMLNNGLNLLGVNSFWQYVVKGVVIIIAVYIDMFRKRKRLF